MPRPIALVTTIGPDGTVNDSPFHRRCRASTLNPFFAPKPQTLTLQVPRPIALVTTIGPDGTVNAAPFSFFNVLGADPPIGECEG